MKDMASEKGIKKLEDHMMDKVSGGFGSETSGRTACRWCGETFASRLLSKHMAECPMNPNK